MINQVDHYIAQVEDEGTIFDIHFIGHWSDDPKAIPVRGSRGKSCACVQPFDDSRLPPQLLMNHGWPGSALEFLEVVKILRQSTSPSFHLIAPNQVGYGWSSPPPLDRGFGMEDSARILHKLMTGLGFKEYAAQGGDIGSVLARMLAVKYDACRAINLNYLPLSAPPDRPELAKQHNYGLADREYADWSKGATFAATGRGYAVMHGSKPSTIGLVVQSSPMALLAWLGEKFNTWSDVPPSLDRLLETVTIWWLRESFPSSIYAYSEILESGVAAYNRRPELYVSKPMGYSSFAKEIAPSPEAWAAETGNLQFYRYHERGGHFAAAEQAAEFAGDMKDCFGKLWQV